jgi:hypothetical protein
LRFASTNIKFELHHEPERPLGTNRPDLAARWSQTMRPA